MSVADDIVVGPDERLETHCVPIETIDAEVEGLARRMLKDMYATDGVGLAAPQVGELVQLVVIDVDYAEPGGKKNPYVLVNPVIVTADGQPRTTSEGCLSFPGVSCEITRPSHVVVRATNLDGDLMQYEAKDNLLAVCLQHEIDHLHGITMIDHLGPAERVRVLGELEAALDAGARPGDVDGTGA
ncbi:MAG: peptide deformylase [Atopobium sp.]|jgi:peptide deformylase|nr:peptide deformylase [Atopobium sp.]